jgi:hypothetical protein
MKLAKTKPAEFVNVYLVRSGNDAIHLARSEPPILEKYTICCALSGYSASREPYLDDFKRVTFRVSDGGRMPVICPSCVRAQPRARIVESPPKKKKEK